MKLTYRGITYDYNPPAVATVEDNATGTYRGVDIRFRNVKKNAVHQPTLDLIYRGVAYTTGEVNTGEAKVPAAATVPANSGVVDKARLAMMKHHRAVKQRQQVMLGRLASEVGLPASAAHYWNHIQGKVHPSFWATYDRSHATLS
ncbi:MAG: DUF4278 domain-containing protein [Cyanobacteria bacterium P01_A01_bin.123]